MAPTCGNDPDLKVVTSSASVSSDITKRWGGPPMNGLRTLVICTPALVLLCASGFVVDAAANQQAQTPEVQHASAQKNMVPAWFLNDVQLAERANLKSGTNYMVNYGEGSVPSNVQMQLNQIWFGVPTNIRENPFFGYSWSGVYQNVKTQPQPLTSISVLEQAEQGGNTVGVLVSAKSMSINNGAFIAFANGQIITAADKSGELFYTVYPIEGVSVPSANQPLETTPLIVPAYVAWNGYAYEEEGFINHVGSQIGVATDPKSAKVYRVPGKNPNQEIAIKDSTNGKYISAVREVGTVPPNWMGFNSQEIGTTIRPGEKITISGNVFFRALYCTSIQVTVRRYGYGQNTVLKDFKVADNGTFKGTIEIPKQLFGQPGKTYYNLAFWVPDRTSTVDLTMTLKRRKR